MRWVAFLVLGVVLAFASGCRIVPITGRHQLMLSSSNYENQLGLDGYKQYKEKYQRSQNEQYNQALARVGGALKQVAEQDDFEWEFVVLETTEQNAFCLPGGKVAVLSGIMTLMENEAELACVVGHEIGHAIARHSGERLSWGYLQTLGTIGLSMANETAGAVFGVGSELGVMLPFSRSNESEADYIGLVLMAKAGYDPVAAISFWQKFGNGSHGLKDFLSTHPNGDKRIADLQKALPEAQKLYSQAKVQHGLGETLAH